MDLNRDRPDRLVEPIKAAIEVRRRGQTVAHHEFDARDLSIGRNPRNAMVLDDLRVSRRHAQIERHPDGRCFLLDLGSRGGTFLDGRRLPPFQPIRLANQHTIRIVDHELIFRLPTFELDDSPEDRFLMVMARVSSAREPFDEWLALGGAGPECSGLLLDVARILACGTELGTMLDLAVDEVLNRFPQADGGVVLVPHSGRNGEFHLEVGSFRPRAGTFDCVVSSACLARRAFERNEALFLTERPREIFFADEGFVDGPIRSWLSVPLLGLDARPIGLIQIYSQPFDSNSMANGLSLFSVENAGSAEHFLNTTFTSEDLGRLVRLALPLGLAIEFQNLELRHPGEACQEIQATLVPAESPQVPGYSLLGNWSPERRFNGRFHDFVPRLGGRTSSEDSPRWIAVAGETSGNGLCSALVMTDLCLEIRRQARAGVGIEEIAARVNRMIHEAGTEPDGISFHLAEVDPHEHRVSVVCAGQCVPRVHRNADRRGKAEIDPENCGPPLGAVADAVYCSASVVLEPGDGLKLRFDRPITANSDGSRPLGDETMVWLIRDRVSWLNHGAINPLGACRDGSPASAPGEELRA